MRGRTRRKTPKKAHSQSQVADLELPSRVVGIGASAGGLEAFSELLRYLPAKTGMAFVFIQHLEPKQWSRLPEILSRITTMPVEVATEGLIV
jgi:two-component system, chemotaxis family, CheB/CheR fusion protein